MTMVKDLEQFVWRTRKQKLRSNLCQAYQTLANLPSLSFRFEKIKEELNWHGDEVLKHANVVRNARLAVPSLDLKGASGFMDDLILTLGGWKQELGEIESGSFLAQVKLSGVDDWRNDLQMRADDLRNHIDQDVTTWNQLTKAEADAQDQVFGRSVELLGGIALRDARLNADVCELADELLRSIRPTELKHYAILGGLSIILMRLERIIRLPFPQWSVWDLPFAVHEFWHVNRKTSSEVRERIMRALPPGLLNDTQWDACLADAFAVYSVGPAFGFAAIALWFLPSDPSYDPRVQIIRAMLRAMDQGWGGGASESYLDVANDLEIAWRGAVDQARSGVPPSPASSGPFEAIYAELMKETVDDALKEFVTSNEFQNILNKACCRAFGETAASLPPQVDDAQFDEVCRLMIEHLQRLGYKRFPLSDWMNAKSWKPVLEGNDKSHDLRHVLNAAWEARVESTTEDDAALTAKLTERAKRFLKPQPVGVDPRLPQGAPR